MKKILFTKLSNSLLEQKPPQVVITVENSNKNMYIARKTMQPAYQEFFKALFKLPDRQEQARVLDAINGRSNKLKPMEIIQTCDVCKNRKVKRHLVDVATQTIETTKASDLEDNKNASIDVYSSIKDDGTSSKKSETVVSNEMSDPKKTKRKQRRKVRVPTVIKRSQAKDLHQQQQQQQEPTVQKRKSEPTDEAKLLIKETESDQGKDSPNIKRQRCDSFSSTDFHDAIQSTSFWESTEDEFTKIKRIMTHEFLQAEIIQPDGLIPIHSAIMSNDLLGLKRQIYVWKRLKKVDLNDLITDDDEDCLQLAVIQNKSNYIVRILIENSLNLNSLDNQFNTLIHLAVLNDVDVDVLDTLISQIDLNMLLKFNYDGFTALHLAIRQENFLQAETILNAIDKRLTDQVSYQRESAADTKEEFLNYYEKQCDHEMFKQQNPSKQRLKQQLINAGDNRSGNTALLNAIENKFEHLIYFLLAHNADPRIESHGGQSARAYLGEFAKSLNLSLKIDRIMQEVENFLDQ